jgi:hypothetical protein
MMKTKQLFFLTTAGILFFSLSSAAQDYAVTSRGDTLRGEIKIFNFGNDRKIQVVGTDKKKNNVPILGLRSFSKENEVYHPVKGTTGYVFMKLIKEGYLSLYAFQLPNQVTYDGSFLLKKDGESLEVPNLNFKKALKKFLEDCSETVAKIDDGTYSRKDVKLIVEDFNACIARKTEVRPAPAPVTVIAEEVRPADSGAWADLEQKVTGLGDFPGKTDALDMIGEIRLKLSRQQKVPNFMVEGLKTSLKDRGVDAELNAALEEIK